MTIEISEDVTWCFIIIKGVIKDHIPFKQADFHHLLSIMKQSEHIGAHPEDGVMFSDKGLERPFAHLIIYNHLFEVVGPRLNIALDEFSQLLEYLSSVH